MRALILGGYGAVGSPVVAALRGEGHEAVTAGRDRTRADRAVDLREPGLCGYRDALDGVDVVVNAAGVEDPTVVALAAAAGVAFVDITATTGYVAALERLEMPAPVLLSVGLAPGLTNLLAADLHARQPTAGIDLAVLLGAGDAHGAAAEEWSIGLLGRRFRDPATGAAVRNFGSPRTFALPGYGRRRLYRADFSDQHVLTRDLGVPVRTYFGLDSRAATAALALLTRVPTAGRLATGVSLPGSDAWLVLAESGNGRTRWAAGRDQSHATGTLAAVAARTPCRTA
jgi:saccharopine dehydrogenase-like NADP-dependent oxidoreductase